MTGPKTIVWGPWRRVYPESWTIRDVARWGSNGEYERRTASGLLVVGTETA